MSDVNTMTVAEAIGKGIYSIPETLVSGIKRTKQGWELSDQEMMDRIAGQNDRAFKVLIKMVKSVAIGSQSPLSQAIKIIVEKFIAILPESEKQKLLDRSILGGIQIGTRFAGNYYLSKFITNNIYKRIVRSTAIKQLFKIFGSLSLTLLSVQGTLEQAGEASDRLKKSFPKIYQEMVKRDLDMLYFLIEEPMKKYTDTIKWYRTGLPIRING